MWGPFLYICPPPPPFKVVVPGESSAGGHTRSRQKLRAIAWKWTETLIAAFNFYVCDCPRGPAQYQKALGTYHVSGDQQIFVFKLYSDLVRVCRRRPLTAVGSGRGTSKLIGLLRSLNLDSLDANIFPETLNALSASSIAHPITPSNVSLPTGAGQVRPEKLLSPAHAREFLDFKARVKVPQPEAACLPKPCYRVSRKHEKPLRNMLYERGMAMPKPESFLDCNSDASLMLSGIFGVPHSSGLYRFIFDKRVPNFGEHRLGWVALPHGTQFCSVILKPGYGIRGSGLDLSKYFYRLREVPEALPRCGFGRRFFAKDYPDWGLEPGVPYRMVLSVVAMGGLNAVDIAQAANVDSLLRFGAVRECDLLEYGKRFPEGPMYVGVYVDDLTVAYVCKLSELQCPRGPDRDAIENAIKNYDYHNLPRSEDKSFGFAKINTCDKEVDKNGKRVEAPAGRGDPSFVSWGTQVNSFPGEAGALPPKRVLISLILFSLCSCRVVFKVVLRKALGLAVHPIMHCKLIFSCLHRTYKWMSTLDDHKAYKWPPDVRDEILFCALCLPLSFTNLRSQVSSRISATDATPTSGGACETVISQELALRLFNSSIQKGYHTFLPSYKLSCDNYELRFKHFEEDPVVTALGRVDCWEETRSTRFASQHVI